MVFKGTCSSLTLCAQVLRDNQRSWQCSGAHAVPGKSFKRAELNIRPVHSNVSALIALLISEPLRLLNTCKRRITSHLSSFSRRAKQSRTNYHVSPSLNETHQTFISPSAEHSPAGVAECFLCKAFVAFK